MTFYKFSPSDMMRDTGYAPESTHSMSQSSDAMVHPCTNSSLSSALSIELVSVLRSIVIVLGLSILSLVSLVIIILA